MVLIRYFLRRNAVFSVEIRNGQTKILCKHKPHAELHIAFYREKHDAVTADLIRCGVCQPSLAKRFCCPGVYQVPGIYLAAFFVYGCRVLQPQIVPVLNIILVPRFKIIRINLFDFVDPFPAYGQRYFFSGFSKA